ncbi:MAG: hypothetical protein ABSE49_30160 [Polyangiaceae bacterium]|jgi:hypothetical protein
MLRFWTAGSFGFLLSAASTAACVTPGNEYSAYENRTTAAEFTTTGSDDAGSDADVSAGSGFTNRTLVMACTSQVSPANVADATYFVINATFDEDGTTGNGTLTYTDTALALGEPGNTPPTNISQLATPTTPATATGTVTDGTVALSFGMTTIPTSASPFGSEIDFSSTVLTIIIQGGTLLCGNLGGAATAPDTINMLDPTQNICVFQSPGPNGEVPTYMDSQFMSCP